MPIPAPGVELRGCARGRYLEEGGEVLFPNEDPLHSWHGAYLLSHPGQLLPGNPFRQEEIYLTGLDLGQGLDEGTGAVEVDGVKEGDVIVPAKILF